MAASVMPRASVAQQHSQRARRSHPPGIGALRRRGRPVSRMPKTVPTRRHEPACSGGQARKMVCSRLAPAESEGHLSSPHDDEHGRNSWRAARLFRQRHVHVQPRAQFLLPHGLYVCTLLVIGSLLSLLPPTPHTMLPRAAVRALRTRPALAAPPIARIAGTRSYATNTTPPPGAAQAESKPGDGSRKTKHAAESPQQPHKPLPDLRQGIPSTFAAEFAEAEARAKRDPNADEEPVPGSTGGRDGSDLPKSAYETSTDRRRNRVANWSYLAILLFGTTGAVFMGRNWETDEEELAHADAPNGWGLGLMYARAAARINGQKAYYTEPTFQKLLPDKDKIPGGAPELTLVLSLEDLLLHSEWSTKHGYRLAKRPGLDYFLRYLSSQYELVIFTSVKSMDADPIIRKLDPFRLVMWPLFREATRFEKGEYIKV